MNQSNVLLFSCLAGIFNEILLMDRDYYYVRDQHARPTMRLYYLAPKPNFVFIFAYVHLSFHPVLP